MIEKCILIFYLKKYFNIFILMEENHFDKIKYFNSERTHSYSEKIMYNTLWITGYLFMKHFNVI